LTREWNSLEREYGKRSGRDKRDEFSLGEFSCFVLNSESPVRGHGGRRMHR
jgi:hypothetical protein